MRIMSSFPTLLSLALAAVATVLDEPYCALRYRRLCQGKGRHVACQFPVPGRGEMCQNYTQIKFNNDLKNFVTHYINRRRQRLASGSERVRGGAHLPKPAVMMQVEWDRELALLAQRLADQCYFAHDDCRATVRYPYAGQTVGEVKWRRSSDSPASAQRAIRRVLDAWWGERRRVVEGQLTAPFRLTSKGTGWGHFSQLAVWTLRAVGCGAVRHGADYPRLLLVCDFSHTNMLGQRTLPPGPLAECPVHTARRPRSPYPLLCASVRHHTTPKSQDKATDYPSLEEFDDSYEEEDPENYEKSYKILSTNEREEINTSKNEPSREKDGRLRPLSVNGDLNGGRIERLKSYGKIRGVNRHGDRMNSQTRYTEEQTRSTTRVKYNTLILNQDELIIDGTRVNYYAMTPDEENIDRTSRVKYNTMIIKPDENRDRTLGIEPHHTVNQDEHKRDRTGRVNTNRELDIDKAGHGERYATKERQIIDEFIEGKPYAAYQNEQNTDHNEPIKGYPREQNRNGYERVAINRKQRIYGTRERPTMSRIEEISDRERQSTNKQHQLDVLPKTGSKGKDKDYDALVVRDIDNGLQSTQGVIMIDKLQQELEQSIEENQKKQYQHEQKWRTRRPYFGQWREKQENMFEVNRNAEYRPITGVATQEYEPGRHRWKQARVRPLRPGANALLHAKAITLTAPLNKDEGPSLKMDKEDVDQLFRDTGFKPNWRQQTKS